MMVTFEAVAVAAFALLPGALYVWGFERQVGSWGIGFGDRVFTFFGASAVIHVLLAPLTYWTWSRVVVGGQAGAERAVLAWVWAGLVVYAAVPFLLGSQVGRATRHGRAWAKVFTGPVSAPRAWDHFFTGRPDGWIRIRLKRGVWMGGSYTEGTGLDSYASGYPGIQDLYLAETIEVSPESGEVLLEDGRPVIRGIGLLIRWDEIEFLELIKTWRG